MTYDNEDDLFDEEFDFVDEDDELGDSNTEDSDTEDSDLEDEDGELEDEADEEKKPAAKKKARPAKAKRRATKRQPLSEEATGEEVADVDSAEVADDSSETEADSEVVPQPPGPPADHVVHLYEFGDFTRTIARDFTSEDAEAFATEFNRTSVVHSRQAIAAGKDEEHAHSITQIVR